MTSKKPSKKSFKKYFSFVKEVESIKEYTLKSNGLRILLFQISGTGVITSNLVYRVGSRDEMPGETGLAHMLEHMLFKPTKFDRARKQNSGAMVFEREVGVILNATTARERTNYYFSYPKTHITRALTIEAERMNDVLLTDKEFLPERTNVLSEFDMYNGMPEFALEKTMMGTAFLSHPYRHEVIGFREDIEAYTVEKLARFYKTHYLPNNATLVIVGDISEESLFTEVYGAFGSKQPGLVPKREPVREPIQEGARHITIERASTTNIVVIGVKHGGFETANWNETAVLLKILADGPDSILHRAFVDTGRASSVRSSIEPTAEISLASISITISAGEKHQTLLNDALEIITKVTTAVFTTELKKSVAQIVDAEPFMRDSSFKIAGELTEYIAAGNWEIYFETEKSLRRISGSLLAARRDALFNPTQITTGFFIGNK